VSTERRRLFDKAVEGADRGETTGGAGATPGVDDPLPFRAGAHGGIGSPGNLRAGGGATATSGNAGGDDIERVAEGRTGTRQARGEGVMKAVALYARVSSDKQEKQATIDSQIAALVDRAKADGHTVLASDHFVDDGCSGSTLVRPALEKLRDCAAEGGLDLLYVHSPDRLARKYAYQVLLIEELSRSGVSVVFLNGPASRTAEDELLLQVQGMIAEYERAKILERSRRGKLHKARSGVANVLSHAPYGYRYVRRTDTEPASYQVLLHEANVVRQVFRWYVEEHLSLNAMARRLTERGVPTRKGVARWPTSSLWAMLRNPAYMGRAAYGKTEGVAKSVRLRPVRGKSWIPRREKSTYRPRPASEWMPITVPAIISEDLFATAQAQLERSRDWAARNARDRRYLLSGLVVCAVCGYGYCGRTMGNSSQGGKRLMYYFCGGRQRAYMGDGPICRNPGVRADRLHEHVWESVKGIVQQPERVLEEWTRRNESDGTLLQAREDYEQAKRFVTSQEQTLRRLQDAYEAGALTVEELKVRTERVRARIIQAQQDLGEAEANLSKSVELRALAGQVSSFAEQVRAGLDGLDWHGQRRLIRTLVSRIEIDEEGATIVYRIPGIARPPGMPDPGADVPVLSVASMESGVRRHRTDRRRVAHRR
jgi:site-specific DNA recombinase